MNRAKLIRYEKGLTSRAACVLAGISYPTLQRIEEGETPSAPVAKKLADCYGVTVAQLLELDEEAAA